MASRTGPRFETIPPAIWKQRDYREVAAYGPETQLVAWFLMTAPNGNMTGIFEATAYEIGKYTQLPPETVEDALHSLCEAGFCRYDFELEYVWVRNTTQRQFRQNPSEKQLKGIHNHCVRLMEEEAPFVEEYMEHVASLYPGFRELADLHECEFVPMEGD